MVDQTSLYEAMGGRATFEQLVSHFYALVSGDPILRPMYPDEDFKGAARRLLMFLPNIARGTSVIYLQPL